jgi:antirestriction protein ArdC
MATPVYQIVTDRIIGLLESGTVPWRRPWTADVPRNAASGHEYRGVNFLLLGSLPFERPLFLTFKQALELGGNVRKREHGFPVIYWKMIEKETEDGAKDRFPLLRYSTVFNVSQCDGMPVPGSATALPARPEPGPVAEAYLAREPFLRLDHGGDSAFYDPRGDSIRMPVESVFSSRAEYLATLYHEMVHSTGHDRRLGRFKDNPDQFQFSSGSYSREELVAEMGSAFLSSRTGLDGRLLENSAAYISSWLNVLRQPKNARLVVEASGKAQAAAEYILAGKAVTA